MKKYIRKYSLNESIFSTINAESCYWAGFIAADGTIYDNMVKIVLHKKDIKHVELFLNFVMGNYKIKNIGKYCEVCIYSKQIVDDLLHNFNVFKKKSLTIDLPDLSSCMIRHYIRGYFDGDGCITWNKKQNLKISVVSGSFKQIENIKKVVCKQTGIELLFYTYTKKKKK
ncbi:MAG: LAGLIDADG family homing endonuclease [Patescibacteria group bacterium]|jgi:hypothetical protein